MNKKNGILIQARIGSSRLRSKVLHKIQGKSILEIGYLRLKKSKKADQIIYLIPDTPENKILEKEISKFGGNIFLGSEYDLVSRHLEAAKQHKIENIVRVTSDCPLVDPVIVDRMIDTYKECKINNLYLSNYTPPEYSNFCNGSDIEIFSIKMLKKINTEFNSRKDREHVTFPFWDGRFKCHHLRVNWNGEFPINKIRLTVDFPEDIKVLEELSSRINLIDASLEDICKIYQNNELGLLNSHFDSKAGWI